MVMRLYFASLERKLCDWMSRTLESSSTVSPRSNTAAAPIPDPAMDIIHQWSITEDQIKYKRYCYLPRTCEYVTTTSTTGIIELTDTHGDNAKSTVSSPALHFI